MKAAENSTWPQMDILRAPRSIRGKLTASSIYLRRAHTPLCNYHLLFRAAYCGHAWLCRADRRTRGLGCFTLFAPSASRSLVYPSLPYCLITPRSLAPPRSPVSGAYFLSTDKTVLGGIGSAQSAAQGPGAEIVRILAPIFSEQIALVRSTTLDYGAAPSTSPTKGNSSLFS